jgi:hypothetical protein
VVGGERRVGFEFEAEQDFGEEEIGAFLRMDEAGVFADPAEAGALGQVAFEERAGVGVVTVGDGMPDLRFDELDEALQARREDEVVVFAEGVGGDTTLDLTPGPSPGRRGEKIWSAEDEDGLTFRQEQARVGAHGAGAVCREVGHVGVMAAGEPVFKKFYVRSGVGSRHTGQDESQPVRFFKNGLFENGSH